MLEYPDGDFLKLGASVEREDDNFMLFLNASLDEPTFPFTVDVVLGALFAVADEPDLEPDDVEATLVFMAYPYLRELIASITARSPAPQYFLPPLGRLPHPSVFGSTEDA